MGILMIPFLLLGPGLIVASFFAKRLLVRVLTSIGGVVMIGFLVHQFSVIPLAYEHEHRSTENRYHRQIITALDEMLTEGRTEAAKELTGLYLIATKDSTFLRRPLGEIVNSLASSRRTPSAPVPDNDPPPTDK